MFQGSDQLLTNLELTKLGFTPQVLTGAGAANTTATVTYLRNTTTQAVTLAKAPEGTIKILVQQLAGGTMTCTPVGGVSSGTTIVAASVGLVWMGIFIAGKWYTIVSTMTVS